MIEFCKVTLYKGNIKYFYKLEINNWRSENFQVVLPIASKKEIYIQTISGMRKTISTENKEYYKLYSY